MARVVEVIGEGSEGQISRLRELATILPLIKEVIQIHVGSKSETITFEAIDGNQYDLACLSTPVDGAWFELDKLGE